MPASAVAPRDRAARDAADGWLRRAAAFHAAHAVEPGVSSTFGYFTHHPVAPLNRKRLILLLDTIDRRSRELERPLRVLDLACGGGLIASAIASLGHRTLGLDLRDDEIALARQFAAEAQSSARFERADLLDDPAWEQRAEDALDGTPDAVVLAYALHHLLRVDEFVARLGAWLPPGASLVINEENPRSAIFRLKHRVRTWIQHDTDVEWHRTYDGWKQLLDAHGFSTASPAGADLLPVLGDRWPAACWSLVFTARKVVQQT